MERIFNNAPGSVFQGVNTAPGDDDDTYESFVRAMIDDSVDYEESELGPAREKNQEYYYGTSPGLDAASDGTYNSADESQEDYGAPQQSTAVSTDVRDTVMSIMPSLMRTFAGTEHSVVFAPNNQDQVEMVAQATDYIRYKFWRDNDGFLILHSAIKDCLTVKVGVVTWWTDETTEVAKKTFTGLPVESFNLLMKQAEEAGLEPEIDEMDQVGEDGIIPLLTIKYLKSKPSLKVEAVPPEEFRISRRAKSVKTADLVGREYITRTSELIAKGYDPEIIMENAGATFDYSHEKAIRNPGGEHYDVLGDLIKYGEYYVRIDSDGDGINELHLICTVGENHVIISDEIVTNVRYALFQSDPRPHTAIGDCPADLVMDIQEIKTSILRDSLDSLKETLNPRTAFNETLTNANDVLNTERGAVIRTRGAPSEAIHTLTTEFVGAQGFQMMQQIDGVRQARTGISEASKGMDPRAMQSTNVVGIDAIITGAQERIELIARIIAETALRPLYEGLLREVCENPNMVEMVELRGKWVEINPSLFDPNLRCVVNPSLGKGSDATRLQALVEIKNTQAMIMEKFGLANPVVGVTEFRNTLVDMLALANIKDVSRYFKEPTADQLQAIQDAPQEPTPEMIIAKAEYEKNKKDLVIATSKVEQQAHRQTMDDDFRRDKLAVDSYLQIASIFKDLTTAQNEMATIGSMNEPNATITGPVQ